jgi:hypothetical protein
VLPLGWLLQGLTVNAEPPPPGSDDDLDAAPTAWRIGGCVQRNRSRRACAHGPQQGGGFALFRFNLTKCLLSDIAENPASLSDFQGRIRQLVSGQDSRV